MTLGWRGPGSAECPVPRQCGALLLNAVITMPCTWQIQSSYCELSIPLSYYKNLRKTIHFSLKCDNFPKSQRASGYCPEDLETRAGLAGHARSWPSIILFMDTAGSTDSGSGAQKRGMHRVSLATPFCKPGTMVLTLFKDSSTKLESMSLCW